MKDKFKLKLKQSFDKAKPEQRYGLASLLDNISSASLIGLVVGVSTGTLTLLEVFGLLLLSIILIINSFLLRG